MCPVLRVILEICVRSHLGCTIPKVSCISPPFILASTWRNCRLIFGGWNGAWHSGQASDVAEAVGGITAGDSQSIRSIPSRLSCWACPVFHSTDRMNRTGRKNVRFCSSLDLGVTATLQLHRQCTQVKKWLVALFASAGALGYWAYSSLAAPWHVHPAPRPGRCLGSEGRSRGGGRSVSPWRLPASVCCRRRWAVPERSGWQQDARQVTEDSTRRDAGNMQCVMRSLYSR